MSLNVIYVKYLPATDTKGSHFKASMYIHAIGDRTKTKSVTIGYDYVLGYDFSCWKAARTLIDQLGLRGEWVGVRVRTETEQLGFQEELAAVEAATGDASWIFAPKDNTDRLPSAEDFEPPLTRTERE